MTLRSDFGDWTQNTSCDKCRLIPRDRAVVSFLNNIVCADPETSVIYIVERITPTYTVLASQYKNITGSEFLDPSYIGGESYPHNGQAVRHEDLRNLSFKDESFDYVITRDVFEHVDGYEAAFQECFRVLKPGGKLVFTIPFYYTSDETKIRAYTDENNETIHLLPPEIHGNPLGGGALCYQNLAWDIFGTMSKCGFFNAAVNVCWSPKNGIFKAVNVFSADKLK